MKPDQAPAPTPVVPELAEQSPYAALVQHGLSIAETAVGFDINQSLQANFAKDMQPETASSAETVLGATARIAEQIQLDAEFFDTPYNTMLLVAIADSWVMNEGKAASGQSGDKNEAEKSMLEDVALILSGDKSGKVRALLTSDPQLADRYMATDEVDADEVAHDAFLESIVDHELSAKLKAALNDEGKDSFLRKQRDRLGVTANTEQPFEVKVLSIGEKWEMINSGLVEKVDWPDIDLSKERSDEERQRDTDLFNEASKADRLQETALRPYIEAKKTFDEQFGEKYGELAPAFVRKDAAGVTYMFIMASDAHRVINNYVGGVESKHENSEGDLERHYAFVRHEYAHTQKQMTVGKHVQLGLILEERKAEAVSDDKHGYNDIKYLTTDLSFATGVNVLTMLEDSLTADDALSTFIAQSSNAIGLRNTLLLMASKPLPYDKFPNHARQFADMNCLQDESDISNLDVVVREALERYGDHTFAKQAGAWALGLSDLPFATQYVNYRRSHGAGHGSDYLQQAVEARIEAESTAEQAVTDN